MAEEANITPVEESKDTAVEQNDAPEQDGAHEATVGELLNIEPKESPKKEEAIPLSSFLEMKKENKQLQKELKELRKAIDEGATRKEVAADIKELSEKHGVDAEFLQDFASAIRSGSKKELEEELASQLKPLTEKEREKKIEEVFSTHFDKALDSAPEYKNVVNREVIKALSLNPANKNKTLNQIIDDAYGHLVQGRRTIETASPRAGKNDDNSLDVDRARSDSAYFKEVMSNPDLKKKYNEEMVRRLRTMP